MDVYLVGGAVRDQLLGISVHDKDWVVVGSSPEQMLSQGFQTVGKDFPVFLHPNTHEEYALARTERKSGHGYTGFECHFSPDVTIEDDLLRRDLTINAMAQHKDGTIIDPYDGQQDLQNKLLRHVSDAFVEDPLRVLRVARFAAKLAPLGFTVADETLELMSKIAQSGELSHLTAERVWQEWHKSLTTERPDVFLEVLRQCSALKVVLPELDVLFGVPQPAQWHPEIDTGIHTLMVARQAADLSKDPVIRFAAQVHDLGKGVTPEEEWPSHKMHCHTGLKVIKQLCSRIKIPNEYRDTALIVCEHHTNIHRAEELRDNTKLKILNKLDVWRKPERLKQLLICCEADHRGRLGLENNPYPQTSIFNQAYQAALRADVQDVIRDGFTGKNIREELDRRRLNFIKEI
ncbi:Multifunctional CCA protein (Includes: CCA-adding enzyme; 2'-nucleotidase; 2',3'-cyclic phosphodiesterase; Phosphatase) [Vibrio nigripulchritudo SO65]|uniref:multifunctional CCA addition/repair protein n=1 Tax=Vibrio nigripulchritudo TaxID=28173 RepID=UPI0003B210BC|nr:multifunctional CCA addition/repair protein [Vibrio nigripulchritudo]CCN35540.1 Multifunctional CCA protein (Includes: CCA-adding enzyme; 2'-nucleotidase; 2',3'-cyclic phosphodiesterase; Phosphatase) [Vibrio nigripulchritudo AM115]CCN40873.1 Multifunctional CCA protein (Includes: CCA-adding enzyme; 2'-nucleotidase; 2',3'-cyclic phosphodiesterase; Phosphatase) [Vibrio nigripulchritudo FTn2]CCN67386.1 Multifunctional CCA protein (Includes: CCA-adding enzyme; 2'-nucleotidase; 2',3'-cyclic phosph